MRSLVGLSFLLLLSPVYADTCADFDALVKTTYGFRPTKLSPAERSAKLKAMDAFWNQTKAKKEWLPCLKKALGDDKSDGYFRFDAISLLRSMEDSADAKRLQVDIYRTVNLDDVQLRVWVQDLARLGFEGVDTSPAAVRWLALQNPTYFLPQHSVSIGYEGGAFFLFGSMDERFATPALEKALADEHSRQLAIDLLLAQYTPQALHAVSSLKTLPPGYQTQVDVQKNGASRIEPRAQPKVTRKRFLKALNDLLRGDHKEFDAINHEIPDAEKDLVAVLKPEDWPLVRKARRMQAALTNPELANLYRELSRVVYTLEWKR